MIKDKYECITLGCKNEVEITETPEKFKKYGKVTRSMYCFKCEQSTKNHLNKTKPAKIQRLLNQHERNTYKRRSKNDSK